MGLKIVYGRAGTGKSTYILKEVKEKIDKNEKVFIITPEQFTYSQEEKLLKYTSKKAVIQAEVISFERMAFRIINEIQGNNKVLLSKTGKAMLVYYLLEKNKDRLTFLGKTKQNTELIINTITELKKHNVSIKDLETAMEQTSEIYLNKKLQDILLLYKEYVNTIEKEFIDENDSLTILADLIEKSTMFKDSYIYIDEFMGFTSQEYKIIEKLVNLGKQVTITICTDELSKNSLPEIDIFYSNKKTAEKLVNLKNIKIEKSVNLNKTYRFKNEELQSLEQNLYNVELRKYEKNVNNIKLFLAQNPFSELENIAEEIIKLVRDEGYKFSDIAIITKNIDTYSSQAKAIFAKYNIPIFIDQKQDINQNLFTKYLNSLLEIFTKNWSYEAVMSYIKTGFCNISKEDIFLLENYAIRWGINRSKWYRDNWHIEEGEEHILEIKEKVITPLFSLYKELKNKKNVKDLTNLIYNFLIQENIQGKLQDKQAKLEQEGKLEFANQYSLTWNAIINVFDEMVMVLGNEKFNIENYMQILKLGLLESDIGRIPQSQDQVILGDVERSRSHKIKAVFVIGLNDGVFPSVHREEGFLNDMDRENLKNLEIELAKGTEEQLYEENFNIYKALSIPEDKLYLSYTSADSDGKTLRPSILITKIKKIFPKLQEKSEIIVKSKEISTIDTTYEELLSKIREFKDENEIPDIWFDVFDYYYNKPEWRNKIENVLNAINFSNSVKPINNETIGKLYGDKMQTSVSKLESYKACPFSFYLKYGLKLEENRKFQIQNLDTGTFMHDVIDSFFEKVKDMKIDLKEITDDILEKMILEIIEEKLMLNKYYIFTSVSKFKVLTNRLKKVLIKSMKYIIQSLNLSDFTILGNEIEFKEGKHYKPIQIKLDNGKKVEIIGKIDRVDIAKCDDGKYIRIIDYKSSVKNIDLNEVEKGIQLQLLTYLDAITEKEEADAAGVFYFNLIEPIIKSDVYLNKEEVEEKIRKKFRMQGLVLADLKVVRMMDKTLEKGASNIVPAYIDSKENISITKSSAITKSQFEKLQKYVNKLIKEISEEIFKGNIEIKPYYILKNKKTPCNYCTYKAICGHEDLSLKCNYNYIKNDDKQDILDRMSE